MTEDFLAHSVRRIVITEDDDLDLDALLAGDACSGKFQPDENSPSPPHSPSPSLSKNGTCLDVSSPSPPRKITSSISAVEDDNGPPGPVWVLPAPAAPGDFLQSSLHKVPSKSILRKNSSYGQFAMDSSLSSVGSKPMSKKSSFLGMDLSSTSVRSQGNGRVVPPESPVSFGWDLDDSTLSQHNPMKKASFIDMVPSIPTLTDCTAAADKAAGSTSMDASGASGQISVNSAPASIRRNVSFNSVAVREYDRTIGDNPSCRSGPPLSLDWSYSKKFEKSVDEFETERSVTRAKQLRKLHVNKYKRRNLLSFHWGHSEEEMKAARRDTKKVQMQRSVTRNLQPLYMAQEGLLSLKKMISRKKVSSGLSDDELSLSSTRPSSKSASGATAETARIDFGGLPSSVHTA